jgi:hypothetical protein
VSQVKVYNTSLNCIAETKEQPRKNMKRMNYPSHKLFEKKTFKAPILSNLISFPLCILFEQSKQLSVHQLELYKTSLKSIDNIVTMLKDFKFQIANAFKTPLTKPRTPLVGDFVSFSFLVLFEQSS